MGDVIYSVKYCNIVEELKWNFKSESNDLQNITLNLLEIHKLRHYFLQINPEKT